MTIPDVYSSAHFALELDGSGEITNLRSVEGGTAKAEVISYQMGENGDVWRQLGKEKYEDIKVTVGIATGGGFWTWMKKFIDGKPERRHGAIIAADYNYEGKAQREFYDALITEIGFPKWDGNDKNQANVTVTLSPETVIHSKPPSGQLDVRAKTEAKQRNVTARNFHFSLDGFEDPCTRCAKVDAFALKMKTIEHHYGTRMEPAKVPGKFEVPNLVFYVPEVDGEPFRAYYKSLFETHERKDGINGRLAFTNNNDDQQGEFTFTGVHIFNVQAEKADSGSDEIKMLKIECAVEKLSLTLNVDAGQK